MTDRPRLLQIGSITERMRERLSPDWDIHVLFDQDDRGAFLEAEGDSFLGVLTDGHWGVPEDVAVACASLKIVSSYGVGYDAIDADGLAARGILVAHTPDVLNDEVADTAIMLWLMASRRALQADAWARSGDWAEKGAFPLTRSVRGRDVGILGMGRIGQAIAEQATAFDARIHYHARSEKDLPYTYHADLTGMARACEVLVVITPGGDATRHLVNREVMDALGPDGLLINVARGSVVDEEALIAALSEGRLGSAALDVFDQEPKIPDALKSMENVVLLPHVGSATVETRQAMGDLVCDNLAMFLAEGRVKTPVPECRALNE